MASRADEYRQRAQDCSELANMVSFGPSRNTLIDMAREWEQLANEQDRATDLRKPIPFKVKGHGKPASS
jgi:hypothetical protein